MDVMQSYAEEILEIIEKREESKMKTYIFTFGCGHPFAGRYVKIDGTYEGAREKMFEMFGKNWAFQYEESEYHEWFEKHPEVPKEEEMILP